MFATVRQTGRLLLDGTRSALLLKPRPAAFEASLPSTVWLAIAGLCAAAAFEFVLSDGSAWFNPQGIVLHCVALAALVGFVGLLPVGRTGASPAQLLTGTLALATVVLLLSCALLLAIRKVPLRAAPALSEASITAWAPYVLAGALCIALVRLGYGLATRLKVVSALALTIAVPLAALTFPNAPIFLSRETAMGDYSLLQSALDLLHPRAQETAEDEEPRPRIDAEAALMRQTRVLASALEGLQPPRDDRPEYFFLGFAPYASQDVFKREVTAVRKLFDERFGTAGRSLVLLNHRDTVSEQPLASMTNLGTALDRIGRLMRADRDVLVLFVTSHGTKGQIVVQFPGFPLNTMTPDRLAAALDRAGIVNRVLVLSACHSGSFVERLRTDTTLILTAAHADKTSFGCSNENEWTYFGDAYFNHALRSETSLIDAFDKARTLIASWEQKDNLEPSEPQIFIGSEIKSRLDAVNIGATAK